MDILEVAKLEKGAKIFHVDGIIIRSYTFLSEHPKDCDYIYLVKVDDITEVVSFYLPKKYNTFFTTDYNEAKEKMWSNLKALVESKNKIFMNNSKNFKFD